LVFLLLSLYLIFSESLLMALLLILSSLVMLTVLYETDSDNFGALLFPISFVVNVGSWIFFSIHIFPKASAPIQDALLIAIPLCIVLGIIVYNRHRIINNMRGVLGILFN